MKPIVRLVGGMVFLSAEAIALWFLWTYYQTQFTPKQDEVKIAVIGDSEGVNPTFEKILEQLQSENLDQLIHVGDLTALGDPSDMQQVLSALQTQPYPTQVVVGNNDLGPSNTPDLSVFESLVRTPTYTSFDIDSVHLVLLDNANRQVGFSEEELLWFENDLHTNTQPWVLLFMHRPIKVPFEELIGGDETKKSRQSNEHFLSILAKYPVDHIFTGHLETFVEYDLAGTRVTVTGGAHDRPNQTGFGVSLPNEPHYTLVTISDTELQVEKILVDE